MKKRAIALLSGGLDSSVAFALARESHDVILALTFDYGQHARAREIEAARALCASLDVPHQVIELPWLASATEIEIPNTSADELDDKMKSLERARRAWVPNRNGLFANVAACFADAKGAGAIVMGLNAEEGEIFPDNTLDFAKALNECFKFSTQVHPVLVSPTAEMMKHEIAEQAYRMKLLSFWSCYRSEERMCGRCESCVRTIRAFNQAGHFDHIRHRFSEVVG
jgi:7-cyano-7-deazaguanine synthase